MCPEPENHLLMVHCGYFGEVPREFCESWTLRPKALAIVNENATIIDGRMKTGAMTLAKLHPELKSVQVIDGELEGYSQYPGSDCRNGAPAEGTRRPGADEVLLLPPLLHHDRPARDGGRAAGPGDGPRGGGAVTRQRIPFDTGRRGTLLCGRSRV